MLFFAELDLVYAWTLATSTPVNANTALNRHFADMMPLRWWAVLWAVIGVGCLVEAFLPVDKYGYEASWLLYSLWGGLAAVGALFADVPPSAPAIWLSLAGLVWRLSKWTDVSYPERPSSSENEG